MFINAFCKSLFILITFLLQENLCESSSEKSEKQLKYDACYKLVQSRAEQDKDHFRELTSELKPEEVNNILQYSLFECYQNIDFYDAEFLDEKNIKEINIYQDKYEIYSDNKKKNNKILINENKTSKDIDTKKQEEKEGEKEEEKEKDKQAEYKNGKI